MKISRHLKLIGLAALGASIPLSIYASSFSQLTVTYWGTFGYTNVIPAYYPSVAIGMGNTISYSNALAAGEYLQSVSPNSLVVGTYNTPRLSGLLVVGHGTPPQSGPPPVGAVRRNAFEVLTNGDVNVPLNTSTSKLTIGTSSTSGTATTTKIYGTADIDRIPPKGGISMGGFETP